MSGPGQTGPRDGEVVAASGPGHPARSGRDEAAVLERIEAFRRRRPRLRDEVVSLAHGAGGKASAALIDAVFLEAFSGEGPGAGDRAAGDGPGKARAGGREAVVPLEDGAVLELASGERLVFSTDSFVVQPWRFPGGSIGHLALHGTVNDLAVMGARPAWISAAFVIEEGFPIPSLREVAADMAEAAAASGVKVVTGDTKVVGRGAADGLYVTTAGIGLLPTGRHLGADLVRAGDRVVVSGTIGDHGMAVMLARGDLAIEAELASDTAPVTGAVEAILAAAPGTRWMRDPTRGGVATVCNELARDAGVAVVLDEEALPVRPAVMGACDLLGIDPLYVANEGKVLAVVPEGEAAAALEALRGLPGGEAAALIGEVQAEPEGVVILRTGFGGTRIVDMLVGDPLPRIC